MANVKDNNGNDFSLLSFVASRLTKSVVKNIRKLQMGRKGEQQIRCTDTDFWFGSVAMR